MTNYFIKHFIISLLSFSLLQPVFGMEPNEKRLKTEERDQDGLTRLHRAALRRDTRLCQNLIDEGADYTALTPNGENCLMLAAVEFDSDVIKLFLNYGTDINAQDDEGKTVLMHFYFGGNNIDERFTFLLNHGSDPNIQDTNGNTILMHLVRDYDDEDEENNYPNEQVELLLQYDADPSLQNNDEETVFDRAHIRSQDEPDHEGIRKIINTLSNTERINAVRTRRENNPPVEQGLNALRRRYRAENLMHALQNRELGE